MSDPAKVRRCGEMIRRALGVRVETSAVRVTNVIDKEVRAEALTALVELERMALGQYRAGERPQ